MPCGANTKHIIVCRENEASVHESVRSLFRLARSRLGYSTLLFLSLLPFLKLTENCLLRRAPLATSLILRDISHTCTRSASFLCVFCNRGFIFFSDPAEADDSGQLLVVRANVNNNSSWAWCPPSLAKWVCRSLVRNCQFKFRNVLQIVSRYGVQNTVIHASRYHHHCDVK